ncbi:Metallo-dependent phosphatase-like protein [Chlamydoabsidia padenii]|nr:Metallo-dependent phosphatase-like protein [Chlamydoabsidia padenii]
MDFGESSDQDTNDAFANTFKILIATDNHIGYLEDDPVRGQDSFTTFEEILKLAQQHQVDFILLGGDLFHHNRPSRSCLYQTMDLLRRYCMGDKPSKIWIASDQSEHFHDGYTTANYLDPNLNVSYPVFSIHGNHDDPNGPGNLCALQLLSVTGLVNYFGRTHDIQNVVVQPILMTKGTSKLALYGLGNMRDERLFRVWRDGHVQFSRPVDENWLDDSFNLFVLHQNRVKHGPTNYIPEAFLGDFLDLVLWGHEHDCRIDPEHTAHPGLTITQPGSSVATSLSEGEALAKHVGLLQITGNDYSLQKIRLTTVRPFQFTSVVLNQTDVPVNDVKACQRYLQTVVNDLITRAKVAWDEQQLDTLEEETSTMPLPLIRIRVDYTGGYEIFNPLQFGQQYTNKVANPKDMLKFQRSKSTSSSSSSRKRPASAILDDVSTSIPERLDQIKVEDLVDEFLGQSLGLLAENEFKEAVKMFVEKDDKDAIRRFVTKSVNQVEQSIPGSTDVDVLTAEYVQRRALVTKNARVEAFARDHAGVLPQPRDDQMSSTTGTDGIQQQGRQETTTSNISSRNTRSLATRTSSAAAFDISDDDDDIVMISEPVTRNQSPPPRRTPAKRKQKQPARDSPLDNDDDDDDDMHVDWEPRTSTTTKKRAARPPPARQSRGTSSTTTTRAPDHDDNNMLHTTATSDPLDHQDIEDDDMPLFDNFLPTRTKPQRSLPSSFSLRK